MTNLDNDASQSFKDAAEQTFAEKAFEELEGLNRFLGSTTPSAVIDFCNSAHNAIDTYIDRPVEEKEALKALTVFQFGLPFLYDDIRRFKDRYNQTLNDMVNDQLKGRLTTNHLQMEGALSVAKLEQTLIQFGNPDTRQVALQDQTVEEFRKGVKEAVAFSQEHESQIAAPRLIARFVELSQKCLELTVRDIPAQKPDTLTGPTL